MKHYIFAIFILLPLTIFASKNEKESTITGFSTSVGCYNILGADVTTKGPLWQERKLHVKDIILQENNFPDILGIQECILNDQKNDMIVMLAPYYDYHLSDISTSSRLIFWKPEKYDLIEAEMIDLLKDKYPGMYIKQRYAHFIRLREKNTYKEILVYNVHLRAGSDVETHTLRKEKIDSLCNIASRKSSQSGNLPVIIMGDMNCRPGTVIGGISSSPVIYAQHGFIDTFSEAATKIRGDYYTYSSLEEVENCEVLPGINGNGRIDYILTYPDNLVSVSEYSIILNFSDISSLKLECPIPSDHHPVKSVLEIKYPVDPEEESYDSVKIGNQYWMSENLRTTRFANGDYIPTGFTDAQWKDLMDIENNTGTPASATYPGAVTADGLLYNWFAVTDPRGICPEGWKVPSDKDWSELEVYAGMLEATADTEGWRHSDYEGQELKATARSFQGTNTIGFNALPSGYREKDNGTFTQYDSYTFFWTNEQATGHETAHLQGWRRGFRQDYRSINRSAVKKTAGQSVRCVKNLLTTVSIIHPIPAIVESETIYSLSGIKVSNHMESLARGIYIRKTTYTNGEADIKKIII